MHGGSHVVVCAIITALFLSLDDLDQEGVPVLLTVYVTKASACGAHLC
jgi:hypothetical protein